MLGAGARESARGEDDAVAAWPVRLCLSLSSGASAASRVAVEAAL
jgi:hypothetical protein